MTSGMNLWDQDVWSLVSTFAVLLIAMIVANMLRNVCKFVRRLIIPSAVLGGFMLLGLNFICREFFDFTLYSTSTLEILTYHGLGLGFAALALRNSSKKQGREGRRAAFDTGITVVSGYLLQAVMGLAITIGLYYLIGSFYASGILLPLGYGQGPGQAFSWGHNYEAGSWAVPFEGGFAHGTSFGLAVAAMGFVSASVGGIIYLNSLRRRGIYRGQMGSDVKEELTLDTFTGKNEIPLAESMDKFTIQIALVFIAYILSYGFMLGLNRLLDPSGSGAVGIAGTLQGMIWGFQFLFSTIFAMLLKYLLAGLKRKGIIRREYTNDFLQNRISGFMFDMMVVASIAAIDLSAFAQVEFILPLSLICLAGGVGTYFYLRASCRVIFPDYPHEATLSLYGMLTGTASTGIILLRELDPRFETRAADNMVYHMPWAILFGAPMFLLVGVAPKSLGSSWITLAACVGLLALCSVILFRRQIFRKKAKKQS